MGKSTFIFSFISGDFNAYFATKIKKNKLLGLFYFYDFNFKKKFSE